MVLLLGGFSLPSISASYHTGWAAQEAFVALIAFSMGILAVDFIGGRFLSRDRFQNLTLMAEATSLIAFGASWLVSSRTIKFLTGGKQRIKLKLPPMVQRPT